MRGWLIGSVLAALAGGAAQGADMTALRGEISEPPPETSALPAYTLGARYWYSSGRHDYAFDASGVDPTLGNPTSELSYKNIPGQSLELYGRYDDIESGLVVKAYAGGGGFMSGGKMNDRDWFVGQDLVSNTSSSLKNTNLRYGTVDIGWGAQYLTYGSLKVLPFIGYGYWHDGVGIWGLRFLPEDFGAGFAAAPPGTVLFGNGQKVGDYTASWNMVRIGAEGTVTILPQLTLTVDAALVPYAQGKGDDSHLLRQDQLGSRPNVFLRGHGWGGQVDAMLRYAVTESFSLGVGGRYWYLDGSNGFKTDRMARLFGERLPLTTYLSERHGVLAEALYRF
ncbi:hypothetical protein SAMN05444161_2402 [Rhizobiales bacterium GAS191]|nr:hypothetical protein SAMN05519103_01515 [Rhizobiales bacterium GAS113]SEC18488.1 hypothetical protein SAMN05519104_0912 [Rhizobiales bacterium GAS188]SED05218.1 hypothetical protein SAMN05444161_2402 [Rhizobiales bacterium GAS191]